MIPKPLEPFMLRLMQATNSSEVRWSEGADDAYLASQKDAELHIRYVFDGDTGESVYQFRIMRGNDTAFFTVFNYEDDYDFMRNLYSAISVNATGGADFVAGLFD